MFCSVKECLCIKCQASVNLTAVVLNIDKINSADGEKIQ